MIKNKVSWRLSDLNKVQKNGFKVFSCFHCGGGSSMGYKLAGYEVLGGIEIDEEMMALYRANHNSKYSYLMGVEEFNKIPEEKIPKELFDLDILDGSPPCSVFSMAGAREKKWGKETYFKEGQEIQKLDDLFYHFIKVGEKLQPKVIVAENVKGLLLGNARGYVKEIFQDFKNAGYICQLFLFNASKMGVPQSRERVFFIAQRKDLNLPPLKPRFEEDPISIGQAISGIKDHKKIRKSSKSYNNLWDKAKVGDIFKKHHPKGHCWNGTKVNPRKPSPTVTAWPLLYHWKEKRLLSQAEIARIQTFPEDYNFLESEPSYAMGMSVPPFMTQKVAETIKDQWLSVMSKIQIVAKNGERILQTYG
tara:strand:- start:896 stop:1981 length:1086 start_codon:yes stop_codon:yes gene_type:complete